ncbi:hypothetical protein [Buchananella felis]|uniref:hypothetical protein n=1 Tax=Buchananella felis TaxID=3231492 RepID=UPI0035281B18
MNTLAKKTWVRAGLALTAATALFGLGACSNTGAGGQAGPSETAGEIDMPMEQDGPHAPADREVAAPKASDSADGKSTVVEVDLGNVLAGDYSAPLRGQVIVPKQADAPTPLVVVSHLRAPNCTDTTFAYPCADGAQENRYDRGMVYLGEALAAQGYAVVIPDLGGVFVGADVTDPYDQNQMWKDAVGQLVGALNEDAAKETLGTELAAPVDLTRVGLVLHSRSGTLIEPAIELFGEGNVKGAFAYGPAYDTFDLASITPAPADVAYLALVGEADADVGTSANLWVGHYLDKARTQPAAVVAVPGLGHMWVNRTASTAGTDDRIGCDERDCPDAAEHERVMIEVATDWLGATVRGAETTLPVSAAHKLPATVAGLQARWLAHTPGALVSLQPGDFKAVSGQSAVECVNPDPMSPVAVDNACPAPENGVVQIVTPVNYLTDAKAELEVAGAKGVALHVAPSGTYDGPGTALRVRLGLKDGSEFEFGVEATDQAVVNRASDLDNGVYLLGTVRVELPEAVAGQTITSVQVTSEQHPVELRGVDFWK